MNATLFAGLATLLILAPLASEDGAWRHEAAVAKIEARNADTPKGAIVFVGSSSIAGWGSLAKDLEGHTVVRRGFGGSNVADQLKAIDRIVVPIAPAVVAYYCGDNDITSATSDPQVPVDGFKAWVQRLHAALPGTHVLYLSIKPSPKRKAAWPQAQEANRQIKAYCESDPRLTFVDLGTCLLTEDGEMRPELYKEDQLHLQPAGYAEWTKVVKPVLDRLAH